MVFYQLLVYNGICNIDNREDTIMDGNFTNNNQKPIVEISSRLTSNFSRGANKGNAPKPQDIEIMIKSINKKEGE